MLTNSMILILLGLTVLVCGAVAGRLESEDVDPSRMPPQLRWVIRWINR